MWNVAAGLFNWLVPGTGLLPSLHLNFGTVGASGSPGGGSVSRGNIAQHKKRDENRYLER